jgi:hypothetical protein
MATVTVCDMCGQNMDDQDSDDNYGEIQNREISGSLDQKIFLLRFGWNTRVDEDICMECVNTLNNRSNEIIEKIAEVVK